MSEKLKAEKQQRGQLATDQQRKASDAFTSAWVEASAGTGKTKVLSDRVLRTLLSGVNPSKILCLTYTKAAAVEMSSRISGRLARLSVLGDDDLHKELETLLGKMPDERKEYNELMAQARRLFALVLDTPSGMKIQTIHSFCQEILKRFPLEARVSPYFEVMDERSSLEALNEVKLRLIRKIEEEPNSGSAEALSYLIKNGGETKLSDVMFNIAFERSKISGLLKYGLSAILREIAERLEIDEKDNLVMAEKRFGEELDEETMRKVAETLAQGSKTDIKSAEIIARFLEDRDSYEDYKSAFLTQKNEIRKALATAAAQKIYPDIAEVMFAEAERIAWFENHKKSLALFLSTKAVLVLAADLIGGYNNYKKTNSKMDYEDLIVITKELLEKPDVADWVLYKLDGGIDHVLIDEAQDTSPNQWAIVKHLTEGFFSGGFERARTVFAVGDKKQSIYSFQGADPAKFSEMKEHFAAKDPTFKEVRLDVSFRSADAVLDVVNNLFLEDKVAGVKLDEPHIPFRIGDAGKVELWPLIEPVDGENPDVWYPPVERIVGDSTSSRLATQIAAKIKQMVDEKEILLSQNRPFRYKDFLILVQRRNSFVEEMVSALKVAGVNVAGVDKIKLLEQIAVQDLIAVGQFLLLSTDDLTLATILKSPLFGLDDNDLFALCYNRGGASLWTRLGDNKKYEAVYKDLQELLNMADYVRPFELFSYILGKKGGRKKFVERMGIDVEDGIDEFMNLALNFEKEHIPSMQNFIEWMQKGSVEIKRELEQSEADAVRIMTVHGSKGLQAPVVILPDTVRVPQFKKEARILWGESSYDEKMFYYPLSGNEYNQTAVSIHEYEQAKTMEEYYRLLYVALTRAEDRLCVCGYQKKNKPNEKCWYNLVRDNLGEIGIEAEGCIKHETTQQIEPKTKEIKPAKDLSLIEVDWLYKNAEPVQALARPLVASKLEEDDVDVPMLSPIGAKGKNVYRRGQVIHKLLQFMPVIEKDEEKLLKVIEKIAPELSIESREKIAVEVLRLFRDGRFAKVFGEGSKAEVPLMGEVDGQVITGQIDRLVVLPDEVMIIDYKTNRPAARDIKDVPKVYLKQMNAYKTLVQRIYPEKRVSSYILWTDIASIMEI
ncbi:MAG: double-strand break repair helicase AddA [Lactobacillus sp.]|jgi:ATP-dependent helicase/nuclease subunit A|nr:double-strand break repair helicase AddA [Lactobacillus sp.]